MGKGYSTISTLLNSHGVSDASSVMNNSLFYGHDQYLLVFLALVALVKVFASTATTGGGGCGGTFAPSIFLGGVTGFVFAGVWNLVQPFGIVLPTTNATLYGMAAVMSAVFHAPLTGIFLIAELTGGYQLLVPLMIVSSVSYKPRAQHRTPQHLCHAFGTSWTTPFAPQRPGGHCLDESR